MDTNQNVANNYQINSFTKGMNTDTAYDQVDSAQYIFGLNIRITNNALLIGDINAEDKEQVVAPIRKGLVLSSSGIVNVNDNSRILAAESIGNIGCIILNNSYIDNEQEEHLYPWILCKVVYDPKNNTVLYGGIYVSKENVPINVSRFSVTMIKETEGVIKAYIADTVNPVMSIFIENNEITETGMPIYTFYSLLDERDLCSNLLLPYNRPLLRKISGNLKTQQVQYTYRFYRRYGITSRISPLTNKIQIVGSNKKIELGMAEDTVTDIGMKVTVQIDNKSRKLFNYVQIFRISFIKAGEQPEINLICDKKMPSSGNFVFDDTGVESLAKYSLDEFAALLTQTVVPRSIELNQGYLFAANVKDESVIEPTAVAGLTVSMDLAFVDIPMDDDFTVNNIPDSNGYSFGDVNVIDSSDNNVCTIQEYFLSCCIQYDELTLRTYSNMFTSSLLRSLRRDELYCYGVVFYDKYGNHTDVLRINYIDVPKQLFVTEYNTSSIHKSKSRAIGVKVQITNNGENIDPNIIGFCIVRCAKSFDYTKNVLLVALSRPLRQGKYSIDNYRTPYYPNVFLTTQPMYILYSTNLLGSGTRQSAGSNLWNLYFDHNGTNVENFNLYQAFSPEINVRRSDALSSISASAMQITPIAFSLDYYNNQYPNYSPLLSSSDYSSSVSTPRFEISDGVLGFEKASLNYNMSGKIERGVLYKHHRLVQLNDTASVILDAADVKNPNWDNGFSNVQFDASSTMAVSQAVKQYKSYSTTIGGSTYNNWVSNGMYDMASSQNESASQSGNTTPYKYVFGKTIDNNNEGRTEMSVGWIGPGPVCLLLSLQLNSEGKTNSSGLNTINRYGSSDYQYIGSVLANIHHLPLSYSDNVDILPFYGFGNFFLFDTLTANGVTTIQTTTKCVFDGEIYPMYAEFVNMFKAYDFNDRYSSLPSGQVVYYIPLESKINTYFDYGCNYRNTLSKNLMLEPGLITGVATLDRPLHQYNMIYSDNDNSIDIYYKNPEKTVQTRFPQRICYSQRKTNGENIDNYLIFKPADFIDADSRYGDITELLSVDTNIYFWLTSAFGKLSINERSLVTDNNGETIQLGQGGVLQRTDYLSTKYGMREYDQSAVSTENAVYWIDIVNKAILAYNQGVTNYGEVLNVLNLINKEISTRLPNMSYDIQNNELLCDCLTDGQLVFNTKYNMATAKYTRHYKDYISFSNVLCGLDIDNGTLKVKKYNFLLKPGVGLSLDLETPTVLQFVVNGTPLLTKVFDNQKVVITGKPFVGIGSSEESDKYWPNYLHNNEVNELSTFMTNYLNGKTYQFKTDIKITSNKPMFRTDREGNIIYDIPRATTTEEPAKYACGDRMRGKWMVETITDQNPQTDYCISHIITKFRQSYS